MGMLLTAEAAGAMSGIVMVIYIALIFVFIYFMMIRPQKKEQKRMAAMMSSLEIGDSVEVMINAKKPNTLYTTKGFLEWGVVGVSIGAILGFAYFYLRWRKIYLNE